MVKRTLAFLLVGLLANGFSRQRNEIGFDLFGTSIIYSVYYKRMLGKTHGLYVKPSLSYLYLATFNINSIGWESRERQNGWVWDVGLSQHTLLGHEKNQWGFTGGGYFLCGKNGKSGWNQRFGVGIPIVPMAFPLYYTLGKSF